MIHLTKIDGTDYVVCDGVANISGTGYIITGGTTKVDGTDFQIHMKPYYDPIFENNSWENIIDACQKNVVPDSWVVGNTKTMTINNTEYTIDIIGRNHDIYYDGNPAPLTFQLHDCFTVSKNMNVANTNIGGFDRSLMLNTHLNDILGMMPTSVRSNIAHVLKQTSFGNKTTDIGDGVYSLFLLSEVEVFGKISYSASGEGSQYEYYEIGNSVKKKKHGGVYMWPHWLRSPNRGNSTGFCCVHGNGFASHADASNNFAIAFAFCF